MPVATTARPGKCGIFLSYDSVMSVQFKKYKSIFRRSLRPVLAVLVARRHAMSQASWEASVDETLRHVVNNPIEYLGSDLPDERLVTDVLGEIRLEFLREMTAFNAVPRH